MSSRSEVRDLGFLMEPGANAVTNELANDAKSIGFDVLLHGRANVSNCVSNSRLLDPFVKGSFGDFEQL